MRPRRPKGQRPSSRPRLRVEELEPRILFSADAAAALFDPNQFDATAQVRVLEPAPTNNASTRVEAVQPSRHEIVFVDARVDDYQTLLDEMLGQADAMRQVEVFVLDANRDGVEQIGEVLSQRHDIDAVHLISHGAEGEVQLGSATLDFETLRSQADPIRHWGDALGDDADLLIYGCDVAAGPEGRALVDALGRLVGADVAASTDPTGSADLGGNWILEYRDAAIEAAGAVSTAAQQSWSGILTVGGNEFQVNIPDPNDQNTEALNRGSQQAVAYDDAGNFVVVWTSKSSNGSGDNVYARRFSADGTPFPSGEILVNSTANGDQNQARVASDAAGNFVVTWSSNGQDGNQTGVVARRFNSNGSALTDEIDVNTTTAGSQQNSVIGMNRSTGDFVIAWEGQGTGDTHGIFFRRFAANGAAIDSAEQRANLTSSGTQANPALARNDDGFVIVWETPDTNTSGDDLVFRRFANDGTALDATEVQADSNVADVSSAAIAIDASGKFTIAYRSEFFLGKGVWGRSFDSAGNETHFAFQIGSGDATSPSISMADDGAFVVTYQKSGTGLDVFAQTFHANSTKNGSAFQVNQYTSVDQSAASVSMRDTDNFVVVWSGKSAEDAQGVAARVYRPPNTAPVVTSNGGGASAGVSVAENAVAVSTVTATDADLPAQTLSYSISGGADAGKFTIDTSTGVLSFVAAPNFEAPTDAGANNIYDVTVQVSDGTLTDTQSLAVTVTPVNDNTPAITSNGGGLSASISVAENAVAVTTVTATDADLPAQTLSYSISGGADAGKFTIDTSTGVLSFVAAPNFEAPTDAGANNIYDVTVQVSDGTLTDTQSLAVTVTPVNDNTPAITSNGGGLSASISVAENAVAVTTVTATDADLPAQTLSYSISGGADAGKFTIDTSTGVLSFVAAPNFEAPTDAGANNIYDVTVQVSDGTLTDTQSLAVTVTPVNDNTPAITSNGGGLSASISVAENAVAVTTVTATDADLPAQTLSYSISGGADAGKFTIDTSTGVLSFVAAPNFEAPTDAGANNIYDVTVQVSDGTLTDTQSLAVTVTPVNDNTPAITSNGGGLSASISVAENAVAVSTVTATDADLPAQTLSYSISGGADAGKFTIDTSTGVLSFVAAPNFEAPTDAGANNIYDVTVQVSDGTLTDTQRLAMTVTDANEFPVGPISDVDAASNGVAENAGVGTVVGVTASAVDPDATTNAIAYTLDDSAGGRFAIDAATGVVSVAGALDYATASSHEVSVRATSADGSYSTAQFTIDVIDVNAGGVGTISDVEGATNSVAENAIAGTTVGLTASALDPDVGDVVSYSLTDNAGGRFAINAMTGEVVVAGALDAEAATSHSIVVRAESTDSSFNTQTFTIGVSDVNEFAIGALSDSDIAVNAVEEDVAIGTQVGITASALDADATNSAVTYILDDSAGGRFAIGSATGIVTVAGSIDREVAPSHAISVRAISADGSFSTQNFTITITPVNDNTPAITSNGGGLSASISVAENAVAVTTVTATDADLPAQTLSYSISGGADAGKFTIDTSTGVLSFVAAPNFEAPTDAGANNIYDVTVQVSDGTLTDTQSLAVTVTPVNDNTPAITSNGGGLSASISVAENAVAVTTVTATDADLPAQTLSYSISGGADAGKFTIDTSTGVLSFVAAPNFEAPTDAGANNIYDVTVQVSDGTLTDTQSLAVTVTPVNDNTPAITSNGGGLSASISVAENAVAVSTVTATDADLPAQTLSYSISGGADAGKFTIDTSTGVLSFVAAPNFEAPTDAGANNIYDVTVQVSDGTLTDTQSLAVTVTPVNDNTPAITSNGGGLSASISVAENAVAVSTVTATDADLPAQTLSYSISGGADAGKFTIDTSTGVLSFVAAPNFEAPTDAGANNIYDVTVQVSDGTLSTSQAISVTVNPLDDNSPVITSDGAGASASINVDENAVAVTTVTATDADLPSQTLSYSISGGADQALFAINASTGVLNFVAAPNFEVPTDTGANNVYEVTVQVSDGTLSTSQAISVSVANVNDTPTGALVVSGTATEDQVLTVDTFAIADADGLGAFSYQWLRDAADIAGASAANYTLTDSDIGAQISVRVSYIDGQGILESLTSTAGGPVANINDLPLGSPEIAGLASVDQTLTADTAAIGDADGLGAFSYQWLKDGKAIGGATGASYTLGETDLGSQFGLEVSYIDGHGTSESLSGGTVGPIAELAAAPPSSAKISAPAAADELRVDAPQLVAAHEDQAAPATSPVAKAATPPAIQPAASAVAAPAGFEPGIEVENVLQGAIADSGGASIVRAAHEADGARAADGAQGARQATAIGATGIGVVPEWLIAHLEDFADLSSEAAADEPSLAALSRLGSGTADKTEALTRDLDELRENVKQDGAIEKYALNSAVVVSSGLSVGYAAWLVRGGVLLSTLLSSMPAWRVLDPFPVLARQRDEDEDDDVDGDDVDDSLESMVGDDDGAEEPVASAEASDHGGPGDPSDHGAGDPAARR